MTESELTILTNAATFIVLPEPIIVFVWIWVRLRRGRIDAFGAVRAFTAATMPAPVVAGVGIVFLEILLLKPGMPNTSGDLRTGVVLWFVLLQLYCACTAVVFATAVGIRAVVLRARR